MRSLTIDHELGPIEQSEKLSRTWSPDDMSRNETPIKKYKDGNIVEEVDFGNGVKLVASEVLRTASGVGLDVVDEFVDLADDMNNVMNGGLVAAHPVLYPALIKLNNGLQKHSEFFKPKTEVGKAVTDIGSEIAILLANETLLRKVKFFAGIPKHTQKFGQYIKNLSKSALRWGTAESGAAFVARENEGEPFTLFLSDLAGITDENDLKYIRETFQEARQSGDSAKEMEVRMYQALDGMAIGTAAESIIAPLATLYKIVDPVANIKALAGVGAAVTAEHIETVNQLNLLNNETSVINNIGAAGFED